MINESIFEVTRSDYKNFLETIKPECRRFEEIDLDKYHHAVKTYSIKTGKCLASRVYQIQTRLDEEIEPEKYYIFELPEGEESLPPTPKIHITLETKEEVQAFINGLKKLREQKNND